MSFREELLGALWRGYRERVSYAREFERLRLESGREFRNDHVAFRTLACQRPWSGIASVSRVFEALGWTPAGHYAFPDKSLSSIHLAPPSPGLPKVFVSELELWELGAASRGAILKAVARSRSALSDRELAELARADALPAARRKALLAACVRHFSRPWGPPPRRVVEALERESQFGAWTLLHGNSVNHFTGSVEDIEEAVAAMSAAGVPMKPEIEGARGSRLRQSSTRAVVLPTEMREGARVVKRPWTYAYFELAERPLVGGERFEGFLGGQAAKLFEMTRR